MRKYTILILAALLVCGVAGAAQDTSLSERELRNPKTLRPWLETNALDAETRIAVLETSIGTNVATASVTVGGLTVKDSLAVTTNATVGGTLGVTGVATFTAESVHDLGIDADYITTDAGAGIDTKTEGTLMIGAATADKVEIADTSITTEVQGPLTVVGATTLATTLTGVLSAASGVVSAQAGYTGTNLIVTATQTNTITVIGGVITAWTQDDIGE